MSSCTEVTTFSLHYLPFATSEMWCWSGGTGIFTELSLCYSIVYYYNGAQRYEQFLQVGRLYQALILLGLAVCLTSTSVSLIFMVRYNFLIMLHSSLFHELSGGIGPRPCYLTCPSVLWRCWLGHLTRKIVPGMTYNVSSGTLNHTERISIQ